MSTTNSGFEEHLTDSFMELRKSMNSLVNACGTKPNRPQDMARQLGISRNLTWKVSKVLCANDLFEAIQHLPGDEGIEIVLRAAEGKGVDGPLAKDVRSALKAFNQVVEVHSGDRATLDLMLNSWARGGGERLEQSRKLAFRGNCGVWGAQARLRSVISIAAPNHTDPDRLDVVFVGGFTDFRRLRPQLRWPLFRPRTYHDDFKPMVHAPDAVPLDPALANTNGPHLLSKFCSPTMPAISLVAGPDGGSYELSDGPVGNTGAFDCFYGNVMYSVFNRYSSPGDEHGEVAAQILFPVEWLQLDVLLHRDIETPANFESIILSQLGGYAPGLGSMRIPFDEKPQELSGRPPVLTSALWDRHDELMTYVFSRVGWSARDFRAHRLLVRYPPMQSTVIVRFPLPVRPQGS